MTSLRAATVVVADLAAAIDRYARHMDYAVVEQGAVADALAAAWDAPATAGRRYAVMRPASGADVFLRFVEGDAVPAHVPLTSYGWAAIELCVQDVTAADARMKGSPFRVIGPPARNPGLAAIHPMQVVGPDGEVVFLSQTQVGGASARHPVAHAPIDTLFILVLGATDREATARWFGAALGVTVEAARTMPYSVLSDAFGLPADHLHTLTTATDGTRVLLEIDTYPEGAVVRPQREGQLPPGVAVGSFVAPAPEGLDWIAAPAHHDGVVYGGRRSGVVRSPEGALVEIVFE